MLTPAMAQLSKCLNRMRKFEKEFGPEGDPSQDPLLFDFPGEDEAIGLTDLPNILQDRLKKVLEEIKQNQDLLDKKNITLLLRAKVKIEHLAKNVSCFRRYRPHDMPRTFKLVALLTDEIMEKNNLSFDRIAGLYAAEETQLLIDWVQYEQKNNTDADPGFTQFCVGLEKDTKKLKKSLKDPTISRKKIIRTIDAHTNAMEKLLEQTQTHTEHKHPIKGRLSFAFLSLLKNIVRYFSGHELNIGSKAEHLGTSIRHSAIDLNKTRTIKKLQPKAPKSKS